MNAQQAVQELVPGKEVSQIAKCIDTLLQSDYSDPVIFEKVVPFLQTNLLVNNIIDYSVEPGVDISDRYFVLWEPFIRAKAALLIGEVSERSSSITNVAHIIPFLNAMILGDEDIEQAFGFFALSQIGLKQPESVLPHFAQLVRPICALLKKSVNSSRAFSLFKMSAFQYQLFESFIDFAQVKGVFENPDFVQRFVAAGLPTVLTQIALSASVFLTKKAQFQWPFIRIFLRLITEHPNGASFFDLDALNRTGIDLCSLMRIVLIKPGKAGALRNEIAAIPIAKQTGEEFTHLFNRWKNK